VKGAPMKKKIFIVILLIVFLIVIAFLGTYLTNRYIAEKKIDQYVQGYGITKAEISNEEYPLFNSISAPKGFFKTIYTKEDGGNYYIFHYDNNKVIFSAVVKGNEVSIDDKLIKELKHQPSEKVLH
jgi:outer membrane protein assembly factor BamA